MLGFPGSADGPWARYIEEEGYGLQVPGARGPEDHPHSRNQEPRNQQPGTRPPPRIGTVRYPRIVPRDEECAKRLKKRTLTNLYNERPTWLDLAHKKLDEAVFGAYGWDPAISDEEILERLLELNLRRAQGEREEGVLK